MLLLKPAEVAERCQISTKSVLRAIHRGELRASRLGERAAFRIRECDVDEWIERMIVVPPPPRVEARVTAVPEPSMTAGRLKLTPEMGRNGHATA